MVKVNCCNENQQYVVVMLLIYFGKLPTEKLIQKINNSIAYFMVVSIDYIVVIIF